MNRQFTLKLPGDICSPGPLEQGSWVIPNKTKVKIALEKLILDECYQNLANMCQKLFSTYGLLLELFAISSAINFKTENGKNSQKGWSYAIAMFIMLVDKTITLLTM